MTELKIALVPFSILQHEPRIRGIRFYRYDNFKRHQFLNWFKSNITDGKAGTCKETAIVHCIYCLDLYDN